MANVSCVFWITGLSGSGKTTIAKQLTEKLRQQEFPVIFLDGDIMREILVGSSSHDRDSRKQISLMYARLCKMLSEQGIYVVCATISLFHDTQLWNRENIDRYMEIFVRVPLDTLRLRDSKKIYSGIQSGELKNVVGLDVVAEFPKQPDLIIDNHDGTDIDEHVNKILTSFLDESQTSRK